MISSHRLPLEVVIRRDGHSLARCLLRRGRYILGQDRKNEIIIDCPSVSGQHARLTVLSEDEIFLEDLHSANGVRVDGAWTQGETRVQLESEISIGETTLLFLRGGLPAAVFTHLPPTFLRAQRYTVGEIVVQGSTSTIHTAFDTLLNREMAFKVMLPDSQMRPAQVLRFIREVQITAQLQHSGILPIADFGLDEESRLYSVTRFLEGDSLEHLIGKMGVPEIFYGSPGALTLASLLEIFYKICDAVSYAHERGVVHGSLRPEVITVGKNGEVFVNQWGLALVLPEVRENQLPEREAFSHAAPVVAPEAAAWPELSRFSSPEQAEEAHDLIDERTDVHALGGILFKILSLEDPILAGTEDELLEQALSARRAISRLPILPHWPGEKFPESLAALAAKALELAPGERFASVAQMQAELRAAQSESAGGHDLSRLWKSFRR